MTQRERDRLVALKKAKKLITWREAAAEMGVTRGARAAAAQAHEAERRRRGSRLARQTVESTDRQRHARADRADSVGGRLPRFGPTLASEYLGKKHSIEIGREALRQLMAQAGLWRPRRRKPEQPRVWRERRSRLGELVQWDTSDHDWLEGRGDKLYLIDMIDDGTSRLVARFVRHDSPRRT
jgi:hypothetical protein